MLINIIKLIFISYTMLLMIRIFGSWAPSFAGNPIMRFAYKFTEPYLKVFRRIIPPLGGTLDLSPLLAFFTLRLLETFVLRFLS
jgi:YggT family protein